jgi:hypothetical protein
MNVVLHRHFMLLASALLFCAASLAGSASATELFGAPVLVAADGHVVATFTGGAGAGFDNDLYLDSPIASVNPIFSNHVTTVGTMVDLGSFSAGTELLFRMHVVTNDNNFFSGPASRNIDNIVHAVTDDQLVPGQLSVGFEDNLNGGDLNYGDMNFSLTNAEASPVPEPGTCALTIVGLVTLACWRTIRR